MTPPRCDPAQAPARAVAPVDRGLVHPPVARGSYATARPCVWPRLDRRAGRGARCAPGSRPRVSGIAAIRSRSAGGTPARRRVSSAWPSGCTVKSRAKLRSIWSSIVPRKLADMPLLTTNTDRPIVSATAVAAVRAGLERARRRPAGRRSAHSLRSGTASTRTSGMITNGAAHRHAGEHRHRAARSRRCSDSAEPVFCRRTRSRRRRQQPGRKSARPTTARASARRRGGRAGRRARRGSAEPRPARRAGHSAPTGGHEQPDDHGDDRRRRRCTCSSPTGIAEPRISSMSPTARPSPSPSPSTLPTTPSASASTSTVRIDHAARGAERAQRAELAHPLQHGHVEAVEDQEAADEQRDARRRSRGRR